jgi:hypothetical protein
MLDPERAKLLGWIGAHRLLSTHNSREITANARATFLARFEREVDPDAVLPLDERERRAEHAKKAYFAKLALQSADARRAKRRRVVPLSSTEPNAA